MKTKVFSKDLKRILEHRVFATLIIAAINFLIFNWVVTSGFLYTLNYRLTDSLYSMENKTSKDIVIVAIDDKSLLKKEEGGLGRWQEWGRDYYARVLQNLSQAGARVIGMDILFIDYSKDQKADQKLADTVKKTNNVLLASKYDFDKNTYIKPLDFFYGGEEDKVGLINIPIDVDNIVRKMYLFIPFDGIRHESFDLKITKKYLGENTQDTSENKVEDGFYALTKNKLRLDFDLSKSYPPLKIPIIDNDFMYTNFFGPPFSYQSISFSDVYNNSFDPALVQNKIVLIGEYGATGLHDVQYTPVSRGMEMPGVEIHANTIQTILERKFLRTQDLKKQVWSIGTVNLFSTLLFLMVPVWLSAIILVVGTFLFIVMCVIAFDNGLLVNMFYIPLSYMVVYIFCIIYKYLIEARGRKYLKSAFSHYVSAQLVDHIIADPDLLSLGGSRKTISVLFSDIQGFTSLSERMKPEEVVAMLNNYLEEMTKIVFQNEGTLDKYIGDAIMAFWNAPLDDEEHAYHACLTALDMQKKMEEVREKFFREQGIELRMRVGINTGDVIVGNIGSNVRFDYTVIGDNVNLASRLEGANKQYKTNIMVSEYTYTSIKDRFLCRWLDTIRVKGKQEPVKIYELMNVQGQVDLLGQTVVDKFTEALQYYRRQQWNKALGIFRDIVEIRKEDGPSTTYIERCEYFMKNPPSPDWDGVFEMKTK